MKNWNLTGIKCAFLIFVSCGIVRPATTMMRVTSAYADSHKASLVTFGVLLAKELYLKSKFISKEAKYLINDSEYTKARGKLVKLCIVNALVDTVACKAIAKNMSINDSIKITRKSISSLYAACLLLSLGKELKLISLTEGHWYMASCSRALMYYLILTQKK